MGFEAMIVWLYYPNIPEMLDFWQTTFRFPETLDQGWVKVLRTSYAGFVGLVGFDPRHALLHRGQGGHGELLRG